ncbi:MAG: type II toxin-antitoxin system VapC family toxin [bacterium]|nr:type II toxin-antitoxin system VapC family toxin [bacterium]
MILVDANLLIYAANADAPLHKPARRWLEETLSGARGVGLAWIVILAFVRITTRSGIFENPLSTEEALAYVDSWQRQPFVTAVAPGEHHWPILRNLLATVGSAGNLTSDAHLAALAIENGCAIFSTDNDFKRFPGIEHVNPLA